MGVGTAGAVDGAGAGPAGGTGKRGAAQATRPNTPTNMATRQNTAMILLLLEALAALLILIFIVWWTMFSGRKNGELKDPSQDDPKEK